MLPNRIYVGPHDFSGIVDAIGIGTDCAGDIHRQVAAVVVQEAVITVVGIREKAHNVSGIVDTTRCAVETGIVALAVQAEVSHDLSERIDTISASLERLVAAAAQEEAYEG